MYLQECYKFAINPDKLIETLNYLNEYCKKGDSGNEYFFITVQFNLPLKAFKQNVHFITIKGEKSIIDSFIIDEFIKKQKTE